jgi:glycosyltransferase involved in cell wall biosynthesis
MNLIVKLKGFMRSILPPAFLTWVRQARAFIPVRIAVPEIDDQKYSRRRLLIEVTHTAHVDFVTGIQRVVLRLTQELMAKGDLPFEPVLVNLERVGWKLRLKGAREFGRRIGVDVSSDEVKLRHNDILFMLDSSWTELALYTQLIIPLLKSRGGIVVSCLYDLIPITHPQYFDPLLTLSFTKWVPQMLKTTDAILCISRATEQTLQTFLAKEQKRFVGPVCVFHLGANFEASSAFHAMTGETGSVPSVLMVGTVEPRKGHSLALSAFELLWGEGKPIRLHIVGKFGWLMDDFVRRIESHPMLGSNLILDMGASDRELRRAYENADLVLSASFVEGFGLPLVEAAALNKSLVVSDIPSHREVCGQNAIYFRVGDERDLANKLSSWLIDRQSPAPPRVLSWSQSADELANCIKSVSIEAKTLRDMQHP